MNLFFTTISCVWSQFAKSIHQVKSANSRTQQASFVLIIFEIIVCYFIVCCVCQFLVGRGRQSAARKIVEVLLWRSAGCFSAWKGRHGEDSEVSRVMCCSVTTDVSENKPGFAAGKKIEMVDKTPSNKNEWELYLYSEIQNTIRRIIVLIKCRCYRRFLT